MKLNSLGFFNAIYGTYFNTKSAKSAAPGVDEIIKAIVDDGIFWTDEITIITRDADGRDF